MMELKITKTKKLLLVFAMIFVRASIQVETTSRPGSATVQKVEKSLLSALGMKRKPVVDRKKAQIPPAMMKLYEMQINHEYESTSLPLPGSLTRSANTARSYTHQESTIDERFPHNHKFRLNFDLADFPHNEILTSSELRLTIVPKEKHTSVDCIRQRVNVYDIIKPGIKGKSKPVIRIVDTKLVNTSDETSISLDVLPIIERWLSNSRDNYGLLVEVRSPSGDKVASHVRLRRSADEAEHWDAVQPLLFLYSEDTNLKRKGSSTTSDWTQLQRRKRSAHQKPKKRLRDECRRRPLLVKFKEVGWNDWIVAPPEYEAYYCAGDCPSQFGDHLNTTNHAIVQSLVNSVYPETIPKPCCVPTSLSPISMLYLDENNRAVLKKYYDMVVDGCGCR